MPEIGNQRPLGPEDYEGIDFGVRECEVCHEEIEAQTFGGHVLSHDPRDLVTLWPGGIRGVFDSLRDSLLTSSEAADGRTEVQAHLKASLEGINALRQQMG